MRLIDEETRKEKIYRQDVLLGHSRKAIPVIMFLLVPLAVAFIFLWIATSQIEASQYGVGDPYHCSECKEIKIACSKHKNFDTSKALEEELRNFTLYYVPDINTEELMYGSGNSYNTECDFCKQDKTECYGCKYERERFKSIAETITKDEIFISKLCDKCWELKYANCSSCRAMLKDSIINDIK